MINFIRWPYYPSLIGCIVCQYTLGNELGKRKSRTTNEYRADHPTLSLNVLLHERTYWHDRQLEISQHICYDVLKVKF